MPRPARAMIPAPPCPRTISDVRGIPEPDPRNSNSSRTLAHLRDSEKRITWRPLKHCRKSRIRAAWTAEVWPACRRFRTCIYMSFFWDSRGGGPKSRVRQSPCSSYRGRSGRQQLLLACCACAADCGRAKSRAVPHQAAVDARCVDSEHRTALFHKSCMVALDNAGVARG